MIFKIMISLFALIIGFLIGNFRGFRRGYYTGMFDYIQMHLVPRWPLIERRVKYGRGVGNPEIYFQTIFNLSNTAFEQTENLVFEEDQRTKR